MVARITVSPMPAYKVRTGPPKTVMVRVRRGRPSDTLVYVVKRAKQAMG